MRRVVGGGRERKEEEEKLKKRSDDTKCSLIYTLHSGQKLDLTGYYIL